MLARSNLYPAMLLSPYIKPTLKLELLEFSPNRAYLCKGLGGTVEQKHAKIWQKFEEFYGFCRRRLIKTVKNLQRRILKYNMEYLYVPKGKI